MRKTFAAVGIVLLLAAAGCGFAPVHWDLSQNTVRPARPMVASPIPMTLYVVLSPSDVPDTIQIRNSSNSVLGFQEFLGEGLRTALSPYFQSVEIVSTRPSADVPCVIADVRVDGVEARDLPIGNYVYTTLVLQWAFAIRPSGAAEYTFSFSGNGVSDHAYRTLGEGFEQMTLSALNGLQQQWADGDAFNRLAAEIQNSTTSGGDLAPSQEGP